MAEDYIPKHNLSLWRKIFRLKLPVALTNFILTTWENSKGETGAWSYAVSATVTG